MITRLKITDKMVEVACEAYRDGIIQLGSAEASWSDLSEEDREVLRTITRLSLEAVAKLVGEEVVSLQKEFKELKQTIKTRDDRIDQLEHNNERHIRNALRDRSLANKVILENTDLKNRLAQTERCLAIGTGNLPEPTIEISSMKGILE